MTNPEAPRNSSESNRPVFPPPEADTPVSVGLTSTASPELKRIAVLPPSNATTSPRAPIRTDAAPTKRPTLTLRPDGNGPNTGTLPPGLGAQANAPIAPATIAASCFRWALRVSLGLDCLERSTSPDPSARNDGESEMGIITRRPPGSRSRYTPRSGRERNHRASRSPHIRSS